METNKKFSRANYENLQSALTKIEEFVNANGYQFKDRKGFDEITEKNFNAAIGNTSLKKRKRLAGYFWIVENRPSLGSINKFFHFLMKNLMKSELRIRVTKSDKELAIEEKRKAYKDALAKAQVAYSDYKNEKGDFYKDQTTVRDYLKRKSAAN